MTSVIDRAEMAAAFAEAAEIVKFGTAEERSGRALPIGPVTELRQSLGLSRAEFAERYRVPLQMLEGWEQGVSEPDAVATALLILIAADPVGTAKTLGSRSQEAVAAE